MSPITRASASRYPSAGLAGMLMVALAPQVILTASALAQSQFEPLLYRPMPTADDFSLGMATGDVDGDGDLDLVFANYPQPSTLYLNNGVGQFSDGTAARMPPSNNTVRSTAIGDVDGDGDLDLVFGHRGQNRLYLNDGTGTFSDVTAARMPPDADETAGVALGDVDGDGDLDLVLAQHGWYWPGVFEKQNRLYLNDGSGTFTDATATRMPATIAWSNAVVMSDLDGDGDLDLAFANGAVTRSRGDQNHIYLNDGTGVFQDVTTTHMPVDADPSEGLAVGDVDGDGDLDLVFATYLRRNRLYLNDGGGRFTDVTAARLPADNDRTLAVALSDVDGDDDVDVISGNIQSQQNKLLLNDGTGRFVDATASHMPPNADSTTAIALVDVDGDGDADSIFANYSQNALLTNDGSGVFVDPAQHRLPIDQERTTAVAMGDVDGDGDLDVIFGNSSLYFGLPGRRNTLYLNDGYGFFRDVTATHLPLDTDDTAAFAFGDLDGDGDLDVVLGNNRVNRVYLNDGTGVFSNAGEQLPNHDDTTVDVELGDLDADGDLDLLVANAYSPARMYRNNGSGFFSDVTATHLPSIPMPTTGFALGDVDGDGDLDLAASRVGMFPGHPASLFLNDGTGRFTDVTAAQMPAVISSAFDVGFGDVDGDGDNDIVLAEDDYYASGRNQLFLNDGSGSFADVTATHMPALGGSSGDMAIGDIDDDGDIDLIFHNAYSGSELFLNGGEGVFSVAPSGRMPVTRSSSQFDLGDVDGDGDLDLVVVRQLSNNQLYLNVLRQVDPPLPALTPGSEYRLDFYGRHGRAGEQDFAYPLLSTASANIPLAPFGTLFLSPLGMAALPPVRINQPIGIGSISLTVPNTPSVVGVSLHAQGLIVQLVSARLTNAARNTIQR